MEFIKILGIILALAIVAAVAVFGITSATSGKQTAPVAPQQTETSGANTEPKRGTKVGELAPEFELVKTDGSRVALNDLQGKPAVVVFWSTYCSSCREEAPELNKLAAKFEPQVVKVLGINVDSSDARLKEGIENFKIKYETVRDIGTNVARSYRVTGTPTVIFLDKKGMMRYFGNELPADYLVTITPQFKILIGARFDRYNQRFLDEPTADSQRLNDTVTSPRVGFVYQPRGFLSFYASYGRSFSPQFPSQLGLDDRPFKPSVGEQYEAGAKLDALDGKLISTLAFYNLAFRYLLTADRANSGFSIQTGEQRSRGIEFDIAANPVRGLNLTASYAATLATVTSDADRLLVRRFLPNTARHNGSVWATYRFEPDDFLRGFGFGAGASAVGRRFTNLSNAVVLPGFARLDALAFYEFETGEKTRMRFAVNLQNLTDKRYYESATSFGSSVFPGAPFTALASFTVTRR